MTNVTFEEYLLKYYDINQIEEKENKQRVLRNNTFRVSLNSFKEFFLTSLLLRKNNLEKHIKDIDISTREKLYLEHYETFKKIIKDKKTFLEYLQRYSIQTLNEEYFSFVYWKKEFNNLNIALNELQSLTKNSIEVEVKESEVLSDTMVRILKEYYQNLLNDSINNKQLITTIKDDIKKFDMVMKYDKRLISCKIITI